jgi:kynurenine formamidase
VREHPGVAELPVESMVSDAVVLDLTFRGQANARITPEDLDQAERALNAQGLKLEPGGTVLLRTDWPKGHVTTDPKWWNESPCLTHKAAEWLVAKRPAVLGYDFAQEEKGSDYEHADEILGSGMRVHRIILPRVVFLIENLINLDRIPSKVRLLALPAKWRSESAPARVLALVEES